MPREDGKGVWIFWNEALNIGTVFGLCRFPGLTSQVAASNLGVG